jgi:hypothetical protein
VKKRTKIIGAVVGVVAIGGISAAASGGGGHSSSAGSPAKPAQSQAPAKISIARGYCEQQISLSRVLVNVAFRNTGGQAGSVDAMPVFFFNDATNSAQDITTVHVAAHANTRGQLSSAGMFQLYHVDSTNAALGHTLSGCDIVFNGKDHSIPARSGY